MVLTKTLLTYQIVFVKVFQVIVVTNNFDGIVDNDFFKSDKGGK